MLQIHLVNDILALLSDLSRFQVSKAFIKSLLMINFQRLWCQTNCYWDSSELILKEERINKYNWLQFQILCYRWDVKLRDFKQNLSQKVDKSPHPLFDWIQGLKIKVSTKKHTLRLLQCQYLQYHLMIFEVWADFEETLFLLKVLRVLHCQVNILSNWVFAFCNLIKISVELLQFQSSFG